MKTFLSSISSPRKTPSLRLRVEKSLIILAFAAVCVARLAEVVVGSVAHSSALNASTETHRVQPTESKSLWPESIGSCSKIGWPTEISLSVRVDITEYTSLRDKLQAFAPRVRGVVHLAAVSRVQDCQSDLERCEAVNVGGTENILRALSELYQPERTGTGTVTSPLPWLVFASSRELYGGRARGEVVSEFSAMRPLNPYGETKMKAELAIRQWTRRTGFNAIVLRFNNVYGSCVDHKSRLVPAVVSRLLAGKDVVVFGGEDKTISLLHVKDAVQALLLGIKFSSSVLDNGAGVYEAFNIGGGPNHDALNIMEIIELAGSRVKALIPNSTDWHQLTSVETDTTGRAPEPDHFRSSVSKAFRVLGYGHSRGFDENTVTAFIMKCYDIPVSSHSAHNKTSSERRSGSLAIDGDTKLTLTSSHIAFLNACSCVSLLLLFCLSGKIWCRNGRIG